MMTILSYIFAALTAVGILVMLWAEFYRKREKVKKIVNFDFPEGMTSGMVGVVIDGHADDRDVMSLIPWFASQGYLRMERLEDVEMQQNNKKEMITNFRLVKLNDLPETATIAEKYLFDDGLFPDGKTVFNLKYKYDSKFSLAWDRCKRSLGMNLFEMWPWGAKLGIFTVICFYLTTFCAIDSNNFRGAFGVFSVFMILPFQLAYMLPDVFIEGNLELKIKCMLGALGLFGCVALGLSVWTEDLQVAIPLDYIWYLFYGVVAAGTMISLMRRPIPKVIEMRSHLYGLREYIAVAEKNELQRIVTDNPATWYKILSYAMALGLAKGWENKFRAINMMITPAKLTD